MSHFLLDHAERIESLHELFTSATHDASAAMCQWTSGRIRVTLDDLREVPLEEVGTALEIGDELLTMVVLTLDGELGGNLILVFDDENGRQLAGMLLGRELPESDEWSELEKSGLTETGNILGCAYVNALTRLLGHDLVPSPPFFVQDYGVCVLQQAVMAQALTSDSLLLCDIGFQREDQGLNWRMVFVPTVELRQAMERSLERNA